MAFADFYFKKYPSFDQFISTPPDKNLSLILTIPCLNEPALIASLESLKNCISPEGSVEVIVAVNSSEKASPEVLLQNEKTIKEAEEWIDENQTDKLRFYVIHAPGLKAKHAGAGWARKIAMDEAVRRCNWLDRPDIPIAGFDADSFCAENYLQEIERFFSVNQKTDACSIYFEHPFDLSRGRINDVVIAKYELHLRYLLHAIRFTGFPNAFHTVGSSFALRAKTYVKQGGMNRRIAGEDFYFLNKIIEANTFADCTGTAVYPSSRQSDRVPFGTGATITKHLAENSTDYETYNFSSFLPLKKFFSLLDELYDGEPVDVMSQIEDPHLRQYLADAGFEDSLKEIKANSANRLSFKKRFFQWFNMFRIIKYLNSAHLANYKKNAIEKEALSLLQAIDYHAVSGSCVDVLKVFQTIDKKALHLNEEL